MSSLTLVAPSQSYASHAFLDRVPRRQLAVGIWLLFFLLKGGCSQSPETFSQALSRQGIAVTRPSLVAALTSSDRGVRGLAAAKLAELKATESLPEILHAAEVEKDPLTKVNIADAATWLGSEAGLRMIKRMCVDTTLPFFVRETAARNVFNRGDHDCFATVASLMLPGEEVDARIGAIYLLSQLHDRTEEESIVVLQHLAGTLADPDIRVRMAICEGLRWLDNPEAVPSLRNALAYEREDVVRTQMQATLDSLAKPKS